MKKVYYHATPFENIGSVLTEGLKVGCDKVVYLTEKPDEAARFVAIRGCKKILVIGVKIKEEMVEESFDHSQVFFRCKAFTYPKDISIDEFTDVKTYEL